MKGQLNTKGRVAGSFASEVQLLWRRSELMIDVTMNAEQFALALVEPYLGSSLAVRQLTGGIDGQVRYRWHSQGDHPPAHVLSGAMTIVDLVMTDQSSDQPSLQMKRGQVVIDGVEMRFRYKDYFKVAPSTGYETLIYDCMIGDATLFQRADNIEAGWQAVQPVLDAWANNPVKDIPNYVAGGNGPAEADELLARDGHAWRPLE